MEQVTLKSAIDRVVAAKIECGAAALELAGFFRALCAELKAAGARNASELMQRCDDRKRRVVEGLVRRVDDAKLRLDDRERECAIALTAARQAAQAAGDQELIDYLDGMSAEESH